MKIKVKIKQKLNKWLKNLRDTHVWNSSSSQFIPFDRLRYLEKYFLILNWYLKRIINDSPFTKRLIDRSAPCFRFIGKQLRLMALFRNIKSSVHNEGVRKKNWWPLIPGKCHELKVSMATNCRHRFDDDWRMSWSFVNVITFTRGIRVSEHGVRHSIDKSDSVVAIEIEKPNQWPTCPEKVFDGLVETATYQYYLSLVFNRFANIINH